MGKPKSSFRGGYYFRNFKGTPRPDIAQLEIPKEVVIPLQQGYGSEVKPCVSAGDQIKAGEIVGKDDEGVSTPVHATISGKVKEIKEITYRGKPVHAVVIAGDGSAEVQPLPGAQSNYEGMRVEQVSRLLYEGGVSALGATGIPTFRNSAAITPDSVKCLVVAALQTHPFAIPAKLWDEGKLDRFAMGVKILRRLFGNVPVYIAISTRERNFARTLREQLNGDEYLCLVRPKYPQESPEILTETLTGTKVPYGKQPDSVGAVVVDLAAVVAAYEAVALGKPLISRTVSLGGEGFKDNLIVRLRIGTPLKNIVARWGKPEEIRYIFGNALVGDQVSLETPVGREVNTITALPEERERRFMFFMRPGFSTDSYSNLFIAKYIPGLAMRLKTSVHGEQRACMRCSYCANVCPRPLLPQVLDRYCTKGRIEAAKKIKLLGCIACGLCTYICPSKIPVMTHLQEGIERWRRDPESEAKL